MSDIPHSLACRHKNSAQMPLGKRPLVGDLALTVTCRVFLVLFLLLCSPTVAFPLTANKKQVQPLAFMWNILSPIRYVLEKSVAGTSIPRVDHLTDRLRLQDHLDETAPAFDHSLWDTLLKKYVTQGHTIGFIENCNAVDYAGIAADSDFKEYLQQLETAEPDQLCPTEQLAFWINAYNAICISLIVNYESGSSEDGKNNPPLKSINQLSNQEKGVIWDQPAGRVAGEEVSLNYVEHEKLRSKWAEPALHSCIVCASASCPNLRPEAFVGAKLFHQMTDQMKDWMKNPTKGLKLTDNDDANSRFELSRIFLWFADDFGGWKGLREWLPQYIEEPQFDDEEFEKLSAFAIRYLQYSWQVNRAPALPPPPPPPAAETAEAAM